MWFLSVLALLCIAGMCVMAVFGPYVDSLRERIGFVILFFWCLGRAWWIVQIQYVPVDALVLHLTMLVLGMEFARKAREQYGPFKWPMRCMTPPQPRFNRRRTDR